MPSPILISFRNPLPPDHPSFLNQRPMVLLAVSALLALSQLGGSADAVTNLKTDWTAYASPLVIPQVLDLTKGGTIDMQIGRASHNWTADGNVTGDIYGYALLNSTPTFPGPTIKVAKGVPITVNWHNMLQAPHLLDDSFEQSVAMAESHCYPFCGVPVVTHIHGLENPAKFDGLPMRTIYENQTQSFVYLNNQSASTKLYHDHANGLTRLNTWAGLTGAYIVTDKALEASLNVSIETDIPLVIGDRLISKNGTLMYSDDNCMAGTTLWIPESYGTVNLVNGVVMPYVEIPNAQVRLRWINAANSRNYNFSIPFASLCKEIARDSGFVQNTTQVGSYMNMYPFERVEMICDFSDAADGKTYDLIDIPTVDQDTPYDARIMQFRIKSSLKTATMTKKTIPSTLVKYKSLKALFQQLGGKDRLIFLGEQEYSLTCPAYSMIRYRDQQINMTTYKNTLACTKGKVERWHFRNPTDDPHPFHWHLVNAQCGETDDTVNTNYLKDVVPIPNAGTRDATTITQVCYVACTPDEFLVEGATRGAKEYNFDTTDPYVAHCHILEHEENAMMSWFKLTEVDDDAANDDGSTIATSTKISSVVVWTAMGMSVLGGFATTVSVLVISVDSLKFLSNPRSLSIAFALSAGVMLYISFADMYTEAVTYFRAAFTTGGVVDPEAYENGGSSTSSGTCDDNCGGKAWLATTGAFFAGVVIILLVEYLVHVVLAPKGGHGHSHGEPKDAEKGLDDFSSPMPNSPGAADSLAVLQTPKDSENVNLLTEQEQAKEEYRRSGIMTGIAIAIHNFPEGLALFVSSLSGLRTGIVLSVGIIMHNLPEGVAVAAPVYYATGSKLEAFKWTALSGIAQPCGAFIGWVAVSGGMSYALQASLYAVVAGMLVCITAKELLPGAYRFDPEGKYFVLAFFIGVGIIAASLVMIHFAGSG